MSPPDPLPPPDISDIMTAIASVLLLAVVLFMGFCGAAFEEDLLKLLRK